MELVLLPILILAGLFMTFDDGDEGRQVDQDDRPLEDEMSDQHMADSDYLNLDEEGASGSQPDHSGSTELVDAHWGEESSLSLVGGAGNDTITIDDQEEVSVSGGMGNDRFILADLIGSVEEAFEESPRRMIVEDFEPGADTMGIVVDEEDLQDLSVSTFFDPEANATEVLVSQRFSGDTPSSALIASFRLEGTAEFDTSSLMFFVGDEIIPVSFELVVANGEDSVDGADFEHGSSPFSGVLQPRTWMVSPLI